MRHFSSYVANQLPCTPDNSMNLPIPIRSAGLFSLYWDTTILVGLMTDKLGFRQVQKPERNLG